MPLAASKQTKLGLCSILNLVATDLMPLAASKRQLTFSHSIEKIRCNRPNAACGIETPELAQPKPEP